MPILSYLLTALGAYLLGSIPTGYLVAKAKGIDIRSVGSGNIGATNAMRVLGRQTGIFVLLADAMKGWGAVGLVLKIFPQLISSSPETFSTGDELGDLKLVLNLCVVAGIFAVLGHNYTCWLKFKGGKGIATTAGVYFVLAPLPLGIALAVFILALLLTRYVSVSSILAAIALPTAVWVMTPNNVLLGIVTTALGALAIYKHKTNIQRLIAGTENRLGAKKESTK